jgi:AraC-like DNA-binding protein
MIARAQHTVTNTTNRHPAMQRALTYIETHLFEQIDLTTIARAACVSQSYCSALFKRHTGRGPMHWVLQRRIEESRRFLSLPYEPVKHIALRCGFNDPNYFSRLFKKKIGMSPRQYRRKAGRGCKKLN